MKNSVKGSAGITSDSHGVQYVPRRIFKSENTCQYLCGIPICNDDGSRQETEFACRRATCDACVDLNYELFVPGNREEPASEDSQLIRSSMRYWRSIWTSLLPRKVFQQGLPEMRAALRWNNKKLRASQHSV